MDIAGITGFVDLNRLGAVVTKGMSLVPWEGNPTPRIMETASGMINAVGLQNSGIDIFIGRDLPFLRQFDTKVIVNVCGSTVADYLGAVERLSGQGIDMLEINITCPNVEHGGIAFGQEPGMVEYIMKEIKKKAAQPVSMKLMPNVTDITEIAKAAVAVGTANFRNPCAMPVIIEGLEKYMEENGITDLQEIRGIVNRKEK